MARYKYGSHIAPELPQRAFAYGHLVIDKAGDYLTLWCSNTAFVYAKVGKWPFDRKTWCLPYNAPTPVGYCYHIGVDKDWWSCPITRTEYGSTDDTEDDEKKWVTCNMRPQWSNVNIYDEKGNVAFAGSQSVFYSPDPPEFDWVRSIGIIPALTGNMNKYLYSGNHVVFGAVSHEGATVHLQLYCKGSQVAQTSGGGSVRYSYKGDQSSPGVFTYHATAYCSHPNAIANSGSVTSQSAIVNIIEYDINNYDPTTGTDKSGQLTPGSTVPTSKVDQGDSTVNPSDDVYQEPDDPISGEVDWGDDDDGKIDITEDDPEPDIKVDDITQPIILKDGVGAMSYYLGYRIGKMIRGQMNGFDDVDAELIDGVLYIRDAPAEQTETLLEVT